MFPKVKIPKKIVYLDHASATLLDPRVIKVMKPFLGEEFGNPSSLHKKGVEAKKAIEESRKNIASLINARPEEIIFSAGGTESISMAIFGVVRSCKLSQKKLSHIITTKIEHYAVLNSVEALEKEGTHTSLIEVDSEGFIKMESLKRAVRPETVLISVIFANNEIGSIQPIEEIGKWLRGLNKVREKKDLPRILFHTDACQAGGVSNLNVGKLGVDLMTINGSKIYGPKQSGILYKKKGTTITPIIYGGGQEFGMRGGTENVAGIVGIATAFELSQGLLLKENERLLKLSEYAIKQIKKKISKVSINGPKSFKINKELKRLPNNINITIPGVNGEELMLYLDSYNIAVSAGSACSSNNAKEGSFVLKAIGKPSKYINSSIRITLGRFTDKKQIDYFLKVLPEIVKELK